MECVEIRDVAMLRDAYPLIEEAAARLNERESRGHFAPDIYHALLAGRARGFVIESCGEWVGFFAVEPGVDHTGGKALHVWLAYARPGHPDAVARGLGECRVLATEEGARRLVFRTQRRGWMKRAPELGFQLQDFVFESEV